MKNVDSKLLLGLVVVQPLAPQLVIWQQQIKENNYWKN